MSIHHVTAIAGDPQRNLDFYADVLGLRLVKLTVNFDDPASYHLYFGDEPAPRLDPHLLPVARRLRGRQGTGQVGTVSLAVPPASLGLLDRAAGAARHQVRGPGSPVRRAGARASPIPTASCSSWSPRRAWRDVAGWADGPVPAEHAVRGHPRRHDLGGRRPGHGRLPRPGSWAFARSARRATACGSSRRPTGSAAWWTCAGCRASGPAAAAWGPCTTSRSGRPSDEAQLGHRARLERGGVGSRRWWTASTSTRSTSASRAACCSRSRPIRRASRSTSRAAELGTEPQAAADVRADAGPDRADAAARSACRDVVPRARRMPDERPGARVRPSLRPGNAARPAAAAAAARHRRQRRRTCCRSATGSCRAPRG